jgi:hypothetical protein
VTINNTIFWDVTLCSPAGHRRFGAKFAPYFLLIINVFSTLKIKACMPITLVSLYQSTQPRRVVHVLSSSLTLSYFILCLYVGQRVTLLGVTCVYTVHAVCIPRICYSPACECRAQNDRSVCWACSIFAYFRSTTQNENKRIGR